MKKAVIYARCGNDSDQNLAIRCQRESCRHFAQEEGLEIFGVYEDYSACSPTDNLPQLLKMLDDARAGAFDCVIVDGLDRLHRRTEKLIAYLSELHYCGVTVKSANRVDQIYLQSLFEV